MRTAAGLRPDWRKVALGEVAANSTRATKDPLGDGFERYIVGKDIPPNGRVTTWSPVGDGLFGSRIRTIVEEGDILCTTRGPNLRVARSTFRCLGAHTNFVLRAKSEESLLQNYLALVIESDDFQSHLARNFRGSVNLFVNWSDAARYEFALPPAEEQSRVVEMMASLDSVVDACESVETQFLRVIDAVSEDAWSSAAKVELGSLGAVFTGKTPATREAGYWTPPEIPFFTPGDFGPGVVYLESAERMVSREGAEATRSLPKCSLLQTCIGAQFGRVAVTLTEGSCNQQVNALVGLPKSEAVFVAHMLASSSGQRALRRIASTTTLPQVKKSSWTGMRLPWPDDEARSAFTVRLTQASSALEAARQQQHALAVLRHQVLNDSLGGCGV